MFRRNVIGGAWVVSGLMWAVLGAVSASAAPPMLPFIPFKRVDVDPKKNYELTEQNGPWMIYATSFSGDGAETQAHELVLELRQRFKLPAYIHRRHYDYTEAVTGLGVNRYGEAKKMRHASAKAYDEIAVLVGNYQELDDPELQKALQKFLVLTALREEHETVLQRLQDRRKEVLALYEEARRDFRTEAPLLAELLTELRPILEVVK